MGHKKNQIQDVIVWGIGPEALYQMTRAEYKTDRDKIAIKDLIRLFNENVLPKRNTYHNHGEFFWTKQTETETPEDFWRRLIEIEKECTFENITAEELLISKFMTPITDKKLRDKLMKGKKHEMKKTIEMIKHNTYEKKRQKHKTGSTNIEPRKKIKRNQYKKWANSILDRERNSITTDFVDSATHRTGIQHTNAQHSTRHATTAERSSILHGHADKEKIIKTNYGI